jgi:hypothetical protein
VKGYLVVEYVFMAYKCRDEELCMRKRRCWVQLLTCPDCNVLSRHRVVGEGEAQLPTASTRTLTAVLQAFVQVLEDAD